MPKSPSWSFCGRRKTTATARWRSTIWRCCASGRLPKELAETYDLELSRSYRVAVGEAFNAAEAEARTAKAQEHLDKFLKEHADHPEVARAMDSWGDLALDRGMQRIRQAAATRDPAHKEKLRAQARADFAEARPRFVDATARYLAQFNKLRAAAGASANKRARSPATANRKQRQADQALRDAEIAWLECRFKSAKLDFYTAQTYGDAGAPERTAALEAAAKAFDAVFQSYRESLVGLHAHLWHGRTADQQGQDQLALDIYDEVLSTAPDGREHETGLEPLFAQAQYYRLLVIERMQGTEAFLADATAWLEQRQAWRKLDGYQGVALEVAKVHLKQAAELTGAKKTSLTQSALRNLANIAKVRGEHQQEAILLRREHMKSASPGTPGSADPSTVKTFDEGLALAEAAIENGDWSGAVALLARALELATPATDAKTKTQAVARLDQARYQLAAAQFSAGDYEKCLATAEQIATDRPDSPQAPAASSLAVSAALSLYSRAQDKQAAFARLDNLAQAMIKRWPDKAEADDARIALGQASLVRGELAAAAGAFEEVNPRSLRYPIAMFLAGQTNWRLYLAAKNKPAGADQTALDALRAKAEQQLQTSFDAQRKSAEANKPAPPQLLDAQLLLAELKIDAGQAREAAELLAPLLESIRTLKPKPLDNTHLRILLAAARADAALGQLPKTAETANLLVALGEDNAAVNGVLNSLLKLLVDQWKQAEADAIDARTAGDTARRTAGEATAAERKKLVAGLVPALAARKQNSLAAQIYIADTAAQLDQADTARELYQAILAQADSDAAFKQAHAQALTRIQAQLVGLLRQKGQFSEGLLTVEKLIEQFPNALEPKMEKGRLLQSWADVEPKRFDDAVAHWTTLRTRMARLPKKPPEYYEVVYNAANCLFSEGVKTRNPQKALQTEQLLNATLVLSPKLSGPEMVARYKELLAKSRQLQGRQSAPPNP